MSYSVPVRANSDNMDQVETNETVPHVGAANETSAENLNVAQSERSAQRASKFTAKGLSLYIQTCQEKRSAEIKQARKCIEPMRVMMESTDNVRSVQGHLCNFIKCYEEAMEMHESYISMDLPEEEFERQNAYFKATMEKLCNFTEDVKCWLSDAGNPYVVSNENESHETNENEENESHETNENDDETN